MAEYLYILIEREMIRLGESTVKIGKTGRTPEKRLKEYPNGSKLLGSVPVGDCNIAEKALICVFKSKFVQKTEYGVEYFNGNMDDMLGTFYDISNTFRTKSSSMYHAFGRDIESDDTEPDNNLVSEPLIILNGDINTTIIDGDINNTNNTNNISGDCCTGKTVSKVTVIKKTKNSCQKK